MALSWLVAVTPPLVAGLPLAAAGLLLVCSLLLNSRQLIACRLVDHESRLVTTSLESPPLSDSSTHRLENLGRTITYRKHMHSHLL